MRLWGRVARGLLLVMVVFFSVIAIVSPEMRRQAIVAAVVGAAAALLAVPAIVRVFSALTGDEDVLENGTPGTATITSLQPTRLRFNRTYPVVRFGLNVQAAGVAGTLLVVISTVIGAAGEVGPFKTLDQYRPRAATAVIKAVSLSASDQQRFDPRSVGTEFPASTTHVVVWYRWEGALPGHRLDVHWFHEGTRVLEQGEQVTKHAGEEAWVLKATGGPLPPGRYRVDLLENGTSVTSVPFRVGGTAGGMMMLEQFKPTAAGAAIQSVSLSASDTDEFDATRVGTEFPVGIRRVVVYYLWAGAPAGLTVSARWRAGSSVVGQTEQAITTPAGFGVFSVGPLPAGSYQVELLENGTPVTAVPFRVGPPPR